jgi:hypothetical protein
MELAPPWVVPKATWQRRGVMSGSTSDLQRERTSEGEGKRERGREGEGEGESEREGERESERGGGGGTERENEIGRTDVLAIPRLRAGVDVDASPRAAHAPPALTSPRAA